MSGNERGILDPDDGESPHVSDLCLSHTLQLTDKVAKAPESKWDTQDLDGPTQILEHSLATTHCSACPPGLVGTGLLLLALTPIPQRACDPLWHRQD